MISSHEDLIAWQKSMDMVEEVYRISRSLPFEEKYGLSNQMRRAAISVPSNIAEGHSRITKNEFLNFLSIARGSNAELNTQLKIGVRIGYFSVDDINKALRLNNEVGRLISGLMGKLGTNK